MIPLIESFQIFQKYNGENDIIHEKDYEFYILLNEIEKNEILLGDIQKLEKRFKDIEQEYFEYDDDSSICEIGEDLKALNWCKSETQSLFVESHGYNFNYSEDEIWVLHVLNDDS